MVMQDVLIFRNCLLKYSGVKVSRSLQLPDRKEMKERKERGRMGSRRGGEGRRDRNKCQSKMIKQEW